MFNNDMMILRQISMNVHGLYPHFELPMCERSLLQNLWTKIRYEQELQVLFEKESALVQTEPWAQYKSRLMALLQLISAPCDRIGETGEGVSDGDREEESAAEWRALAEDEGGLYNVLETPKFAPKPDMEDPESQLRHELEVSVTPATVYPLIGVETLRTYPKKHPVYTIQKTQRQTSYTGQFI